MTSAEDEKKDWHVMVIGIAARGALAKCWAAAVSLSTVHPLQTGSMWTALFRRDKDHALQVGDRKVRWEARIVVIVRRDLVVSYTSVESNKRLSHLSIGHVKFPHEAIFIAPWTNVLLDSTIEAIRCAQPQSDDAPQLFIPRWVGAPFLPLLAFERIYGLDVLAHVRVRCFSSGSVLVLFDSKTPRAAIEVMRDA